MVLNMAEFPKCLCERSRQVLESVVGRLYCQRALWQRDPQRVTKFLLLSARDQFRKRMNEQGGLVRDVWDLTAMGKFFDVLHHRMI